MEIRLAALSYPDAANARLDDEDSALALCSWLEDKHSDRSETRTQRSAFPPDYPPLRSICRISEG